MAFNLEDLPQVLITFGIAVIFGAVIAIVLSSFQDSLITSASNTNESKSITLGTVSDLSGGYAGWSLTEVRNDTAVVLNTGEFELVGGAINLTNASREGTNTYYVDYSYSAADERYNISANGLQGVINISTYFSTSGTLIGVGILITIVIAAFAFGRFKIS